LLKSIAYRYAGSLENSEKGQTLLNNVTARHTNVYGEYKKAEFANEEIIDIVDALSVHK
jgi:hypothetical protein